MDRKILIAGVGNVLRGDDGFGVEVAKQLMQKNCLPASVKVIETGIGGQISGPSSRMTLAAWMHIPSGIDGPNAYSRSGSHIAGQSKPGRASN